MRDCADHYPNGAGCGRRELLRHRRPQRARTAPRDGRASRAGRATSRSPTRAPTGSGSSARGGRACASWSTTSSRTARSASSTRSSRTTATRWRARTSRPTTCTPSRTTSTRSSAAPARASCGSSRAPTEARQVINAGKLAMVLGVEVSEVLDCGQFKDIPKCTTEQIDAELDQLESIGVQSLFPIHKFDNALGGVKFDSGATGVLVNTGNKYATGKFWTAEHCDDPDHDNEPTNPTGEYAETVLHAVRAGAHAAAVRRGSCRSIRPRRCATPGADPARRVRDPVDDAPRHDHRDRPHEHEGAPGDAGHPRGRDNYPGVISSHSWGDPGSQKRIQQPRRPGRADHARGQRLRGGLARGPRQPRLALLLRHRLRLGHQRAALPARAALGRRCRTPSGTRSARSTAAA